MKETKFVEVSPDDANETIETWAHFGWELLGAPQEINYTTTHRTQETDDHYASEYTEKTHYVKITFQRDTERKNYAELKSLETEFYNLKNPPDTRYYPELFGCLWIILSIIGLILFVAPGIAIIVWRFVRYSKLKKIYGEQSVVYNKELEVVNNKRQEILDKAKTLV